MAQQAMAQQARQAERVRAEQARAGPPRRRSRCGSSALWAAWRRADDLPGHLGREDPEHAGTGVAAEVFEVLIVRCGDDDLVVKTPGVGVVSCAGGYGSGVSLTPRTAQRPPRHSSVL
jgi:hypothetical protein